MCSPRIRHVERPATVPAPGEAAPQERRVRVPVVADGGGLVPGEPRDHRRTLVERDDRRGYVRNDDPFLGGASVPLLPAVAPPRISLGVRLLKSGVDRALE